jgi:hypothetical protein
MGVGPGPVCLTPWLAFLCLGGDWGGQFAVWVGGGSPTAVSAQVLHEDPSGQALCALREPAWWQAEQKEALLPGCYLGVGDR